MAHPTAKDFAHARALPADRVWFKSAVFYEVLVRAFADSNGDGAGDLLGLIDRLDYLQWLGVDCLWLPPFYDSPCVTAATTSATSTRCCPSSGPWTTSSPCLMRRTDAVSGSSPTW